MRIDGRKWLVILLELGLMRMALADQWKITGALDQGLEYDDNIGLRLQETPAFGYLLRPSMRADWSTAVMGLGVSARGDIRRYDDQRWDCDNFGIGLDQRYITRSNVFSLKGDYAQNCSYSQQDTDTGLLIPSNQSENYSLAPAWNWQVTQLDRLSFSPAYTRISYSNFSADSDGQISTFLRNNESYSASVAEEHQWSRRLTSTGSLFFSHSIFGNSGRTSTLAVSSQNVFGFQLGGQYVLSHQWSVDAGGGGRWVQSPGGDGGLSFGETYNVAISYKGKLDNYVFNFSRSVSPSSFGQIQDVTSLSMKYGRELTRELSFNVNANYSENQLVGQSLTQLGQKRTFFNASAELIWKFAREWRLSASYRYRMQEYDQSQFNSQLAGQRDSNAIMLHLSYNWDGLRDSR